MGRGYPGIGGAMAEAVVLPLRCKLCDAAAAPGEELCDVHIVAEWVRRWADVNDVQWTRMLQELAERKDLGRNV